MADEFVLTQESASYLSKSKLSVSEKNKNIVVHQNTVSKSSTASFTRTKGEMVCFYCRKPGYNISDCAVIRRKDKAVGLISTSSVNFIPDKQTEQTDITEMDKVKNSVWSLVHVSLMVVFLCPTVMQLCLFVSFEIQEQGNHFCGRTFAFVRMYCHRICNDLAGGKYLV